MSSQKTFFLEKIMRNSFGRKTTAVFLGGHSVMPSKKLVEIAEVVVSDGQADVGYGKRSAG